MWPVARIALPMRTWAEKSPSAWVSFTAPRIAVRGATMAKMRSGADGNQFRSPAVHVLAVTSREGRLSINVFPMGFAHNDTICLISTDCLRGGIRDCTVLPRCLQPRETIVIQ